MVGKKSRGQATPVLDCCRGKRKKEEEDGGDGGTYSESESGEQVNFFCRLLNLLRICDDLGGGGWVVGRGASSSDIHAQGSGYWLRGGHE